MLDPTLPRPPTIAHAFADAVRDEPRSLALVCGEQRLSYAELGERVAALSARLVRAGMVGRRVAVVLPSGVEAVVCALAVLSVRAQLALVNPFFTPPELAAVLGEAEPELVLSGPDARAKLEGLPGIPACQAPWNAVDLTRERGDVACLPGAGLRETEPRPADRALLIFTGGTTGEPKAVEHDHAGVMTSVLQHCSVWPVETSKGRFSSAAPIFHIWGLAYATFVPLYCRGTLVIIPKYDPEAVLRAIERERITVFAGGPAPVYMGLLRSPAAASTDYSSLRYCLSGGAPCPLELHREWLARTGSPLLEGWGMSEAAPLCLNRPGASTPSSVGFPVPETEVEVVDLDTGSRRLGTGEIGEVRVRGPQLMLGYRGRPEATRDAVRGGWLYTGDVGYQDAEGRLFLVDRKKDMIIVGGYNVYPRQVDEVLFEHPSIAEVASVGRRDARLGEVLVAFVVLEPGAKLSEEELAEYCRERLVKYRRPAAVYFVDALPRTGARKIDKKALRARAAAAVGREEPG